MNRKKLIALLAITTLATPLAGCTFMYEVENNDAMGKATKVIFDNENEVEKLKTGDAEIQQAFDREKNKAELRERKRAVKKMKEDSKKDEKSFLFKWQ